MKIRELYKFAAIMGIILIYSASGAIAQQVEPPTTCKDADGQNCFGQTIEVITDAEGNFPIESTCTLDGGEVVPCWIYSYTGGQGFSAWSQTLPGEESPVPVYIYPSTFPSIVLNGPNVGTSINKASFGQNVHERRTIDFTSTDNGNPPKFGYATNLSGVGWTSLYFKSGNDECSCPIAGPDYDETLYIKPTEKMLVFGESWVRFSINYPKCTYKAYLQNEDGTETLLEQRDISNITITVDGSPGQGRESSTPGKCNEGGLAYGNGTCSVYYIGGYYIKILPGCSP